MDNKKALELLIIEAKAEGLDLSQTADYLVSQGVIVMPFKVGDVVYWADRKMHDKPMAVKITAFRSSKTGKNGIKWSCGCFTEFSESDIGRTIFSDIKSAERALKERNEYNARIR